MQRRRLAVWVVLVLAAGCGEEGATEPNSGDTTTSNWGIDHRADSAAPGATETSGANATDSGPSDTVDTWWHDSAVDTGADETDTGDGTAVDTTLDTSETETPGANATDSGRSDTADTSWYDSAIDTGSDETDPGGDTAVDTTWDTTSGTEIDTAPGSDELDTAQVNWRDRGRYWTWNLVPGNMEMSAPWSAANDVGLARDTDTPYGGLYSLRVERGNAANPRVELDVTAALRDNGTGVYWLGAALRAVADAPVEVVLNITDANGTRRIGFIVDASKAWQYGAGAFRVTWNDLQRAVLAVGARTAVSRIWVDDIWLRKEIDISGRGYTYPTRYPLSHTFRNKNETTERLARFDIVHDMGGQKTLKSVKSAHPDKVVVGQTSWGFAGKNDNRGAIWPGYFLYGEGIRITQDVAPGDTVLHVENAGKLVRSQDGPNPYYDITLIALSNGAPNWDHTEHCRIISVNTSNNTVTVERGYLGTQPRSFAANRAYLAQHQTWLGGTNSWMYNMSLVAPRNPKTGMNGAEYYAWTKRNYFRANPHLDGIQFDVAKSDANNYGIAADCDADMEADYCIFDGMNVYNLGQQVALAAMRQYFGEEKLFNIDGEGPRWTRTTDYIDGTQFEAAFQAERNIGSEVDFFLFQIEHLKRPIRYTYAYGVPNGNAVASNSIFRLGLGLACMLEVPYAFNQSRGSAAEGTPDKDEFWGGVLDDAGWLGVPLEPARAVYDFSAGDDLLAGATWKLDTKTGYNAALSKRGDELQVQVTRVPSHQPVDPYGVSLYTPNLKENDLQAHSMYTLVFEARGDDDWTYAGRTFTDVPRMLEVSGLGQMANSSNKSTRSGFLVAQPWRHYVISYLTANSLRNRRIEFGVGEQVGQTVLRHIRLYPHSANRYVRRFTNGIVLVNASDKPWTWTIGSGYHRIEGVYDRSLNDGSAVGPKVTVPSFDAVFLVKD